MTRGPRDCQFCDLPLERIDRQKSLNLAFSTPTPCPGMHWSFRGATSFRPGT